MNRNEIEAYVEAAISNYDREYLIETFANAIEAAIWAKENDVTLSDELYVAVKNIESDIEYVNE